MKKKVTVLDVAKVAGVSPATVSYVLNNIKKVSEETKKRVLKAAEELQYYPDITARSLSKKKSNLIGVIFPLLNEFDMPIIKENHYYSELISGVEYVARKNGYDTLISGAGIMQSFKRWALRRTIDGLIFQGFYPRKLFDEMKESNIQTVLIDTYEDYTDLYHNIHIDDKLGAYIATRHLIELGHSFIALTVSEFSNSPVNVMRFQGYKQALEEAKIALDPELIFEGKDLSFQDGYQLGEQIVKSEKKITAIFAVSDILAFGIMKALNHYGKKVPEDFSLIGFDDLSISKYTTPSLTTIKQNVFKKGVEAAEVLIDAIESRIDSPKSIILPVNLIVRGSTKSLSVLS